MHPFDPPTNRVRRSFLGAALAAPVLVVPVVARKSGTDAPAAADEPRQRGYHATERIRTYYRLARF